MDLKQFGYAFKNNYLDVDGKKMHFIDEGTGESLSCYTVTQVGPFIIDTWLMP